MWGCFCFLPQKINLALDDLFSLNLTVTKILMVKYDEFFTEDRYLDRI